MDSEGGGSSFSWDDWGRRVIQPLKPPQPSAQAVFPLVFMLNYSWAHSGLWGVLKYVCHLHFFVGFRLTSIRRLLPEAAHSRIFFPSNKELIGCLTPSALPRGSPVIPSAIYSFFG